jgi:tetratricopeptide (TPR) repeat protein
LNYTNNKTYKEHLAPVALLIVAVVIAYYKIFQAGYITWDDNEYVVHNSDIRGLTFEYISAWFSRFYIGNYHPLTMFSYAIDYAAGGLQPLVYHVTNLLLHICNAILLYVFINRLQAGKHVAFFVALIFAIHPMQTESVSWIAERKTVLCTFFYLLALVQYTGYINRNTVKKLIIVFLLGIAAMLSKGVGAALPASLIAVDIWMQRDLKNWKVWIEKIILVFAAIGIGIVAIKGQSAGKFLGLHPEFTWIDTIAFAGYAYIGYIVHFIAPVKLSVIYPYPRSIGFIEYLYLAAGLCIVALGFISYRRRWHVLCGSIVFYTVNIALVLQFIQFGEMLMADRYLYIAGIGIVFPLIYYGAIWLQKITKPAVTGIIGAAMGVALIFATFFRNNIWLSDLNFFTAIVDTYPNSAVAQYSMAALYTRMGDYRAAEGYINTAVALDPDNYKAWYDKGVLCRREGNDVMALDALNRSIAISKYPKAYFSRALLYESTEQPDLALADIEIVLADDPKNARAWYIKGDCMEQKNDIAAALENYNNAIACDAGDPLFFIRRGLAYAKTGRYQPSLADLNTAVAMNPVNGEALYYRGIIKNKTGLDGCGDLRSALGQGFRQAQPALQQFCK